MLVFQHYKIQVLEVAAQEMLDPQQDEILVVLVVQVLLLFLIQLDHFRKFIYNLEKLSV